MTTESRLFCHRADVTRSPKTRGFKRSTKRTDLLQKKHKKFFPLQASLLRTWDFQAQQALNCARLQISLHPLNTFVNPSV